MFKQDENRTEQKFPGKEAQSNETKTRMKEKHIKQNDVEE